MTLQQTDTLCDEFEAALRNGETVRIENLLSRVEESQRSALLKELLEVEIQFALEYSASDESLRSMQESFKQRFPDQRDLIQSLFRRLAQLRQVGDYEILGELGRGGMSIVYKAKHKFLQQTAAIKVLSQALLDDPQAIGRFRREMQLIGSLIHPNIVRALNAGETDGLHYLAMEFVDGITLQKLVETVRAKSGKSSGITSSISPSLLPVIPLGAACEMIRQAALGLQNAHELKLVHRDIKPANLMLDHQGIIKILDLGLGKFAEEHRQGYHSSLTMMGMVIGTVDYTAPEQCENSGEADIRSDLYSLGCTLYFLLTGKPVYSGSRYDTIRKKLMAHIVGDVPSIRTIIPGLPNELETILQKVLAKNPAERFQTPIEFAEALAPFASPDELWGLILQEMPTNSTGTRSGARYSNSPYGYVQSSKYRMPVPTRYAKITRFLSVGAFLVLFAVSLLAVYIKFFMFPPDLHGDLQEAAEAAAVALQLREGWNIAEARVENQKAVDEYLHIRGKGVRQLLLQAQMDAAVLRWYHGDTSGARRDLQTVLESIDQAIADNPANTELAELKMLALEHLADLTLFGGAASGLFTERQIKDGINRYGTAAELRKDNPHYQVVQWKEAMLLALYGKTEQAAAFLKDNPLPEDADIYAALVRQLAEAVLFYCQPEDGIDRTEGCRAFSRDFALPTSPARGAWGKPEVVELLLLNAELLINDSRRREDWRTLADDVLARRNTTAAFLRQNPGALPFVRRFYELLIQSAVLLHEKLEQPRDKQGQIENIVQILDRMRPMAGEKDAIGRERSTLLYFFLPEISTGKTGFIIFYPQEIQECALYPVPLTRQMVKQPLPGRTFPPLDKQLLDRITAERALGRRIWISWDDSAAWSRQEDALTEADYPYADVLPLR